MGDLLRAVFMEMEKRKRLRDAEVKWPACGDLLQREEQRRIPGFYQLERRGPRSDSDSGIMGLRSL